MRLTRSNDDPNLLDDLERLARRHGDPDRDPQPLTADRVEAVDVDDADDIAVDEAADPSPLDDPFVRRFVRASVHVKRYAPFYAGAGAWVLAMLLIQPLGSDGPRSEVGNLAGASSGIARRPAPARAVPAGAVSTEIAAAPSLDAFVGSSLGPTSFSPSDSFDLGSTSSGDSFAASDVAPTSAPDSASPSFDDSAFPSSSSGAEAEPESLAIVASGYASATGGTPLEQDPGGGGLPVAATGGNDNKRSFIRLSGGATTLILQESTTGSIRPDAGGVKACALTSDYVPARGQALSAAPTFDVGNCSTGVRDGSGRWTFDVSNFQPLAESKGLALTPAAGTASTFQVVFGPTALRAEG